MTRAAILGLGERGLHFASACDASGWRLRAFDPDPRAGAGGALPKGTKRETTISGTVHGADWIFCCVPERLELVQKIVQRAQAEALRDAIVAIVSERFDIETLQGCTLRPGQVIRLTSDAGGLAIDLTDRNVAAVRKTAEAGVAELAAVLSLMPPFGEDGPQAAESA